MKVIKQISLFLENRSGQLLEITTLLSKNDIDLKAIHIAETDDYGILRLITDDYEKASEILKDNGFLVSVNSVFAVAVPDIAGGLNYLLGLMSENDINVEYMYSVFGHKHGLAYMVFRVDHAKLFESLVEKYNLTTADSAELGIK